MERWLRERAHGNGEMELADRFTKSLEQRGKDTSIVAWLLGLAVTGAG